VSSIVAIVSSGVMWSQEVKKGMLEHMPQAMLSDGFSSSEALGMGNSVMTKDSEVQTAKFMLGERCKVFDENDQPVEPGSGRSGMVAIGPPNPLGYYKDDEKTARTFRTINGVRYSIPGDWCIVEADGTGVDVPAPVGTVNHPGVELSAVKRADDGSGDLIVRLYEACGDRTPVTVRAARPIKAAQRCNALEEPTSGLDVADGIVVVTLRPFELVTLRLGA